MGGIVGETKGWLMTNERWLRGRHERVGTWEKREGGFLG
jgi:hypothetical protein